LKTVEAGKYTVPPNKRLVIELISLQVPSGSSGKPFQVFATTSIGGTSVEHPIGSIITNGKVDRETPVSGIIESLPRTLYADPDTDVIFTVYGEATSLCCPVPVEVTFSGRPIDVP
jgi:hypothetical protein